MAVRIRLKKMGRTHRPFFRVCAMDSRSPRDGKAIEELGHYDPMHPEKDARAILKGDRIDYWLSVGAKPSENVAVLIKKYGTEGTHLQQQQEALERVKNSRSIKLETAKAASEKINAEMKARAEKKAQEEAEAKAKAEAGAAAAAEAEAAAATEGEAAEGEATEAAAEGDAAAEAPAEAEASSEEKTEGGE